jgi:hypothetical protein
MVPGLVDWPSEQQPTTAALGRRSLLLGAAIGILAWPGSARAAREDLYFEAHRDGDPIGHHAVRFSEHAARLIVDIEIRLTRTFAFIPVYRYRHQNREVWADDTVRQSAWLDVEAGRLVRSEIEALPAERIFAAGRTVQAERYRLTGAIACDLWYHQGRWSKHRFVASDGSTIDYVLLATAPAAP